MSKKNRNSGQGRANSESQRGGSYRGEKGAGVLELPGYEVIVPNRVYVRSDQNQTLRSVDGEALPVVDLLEIVRYKIPSDDEIRQELKSSSFGLDNKTLEAMIKFSFPIFGSNRFGEEFSISMRKVYKQNAGAYKDDTYRTLIMAQQITFGMIPCFDFITAIKDGRISSLPVIEHDLNAKIISGRHYRINQNSLGFDMEEVSQRILPLLSIFQDKDKLELVFDDSLSALESKASVIKQNFEEWKEMSLLVIRNLPLPSSGSSIQPFRGRKLD